MRSNLKSTIDIRSGSQCAFAEKTGINSIRLNRIVNGWIDPTPAERSKFAEILQVDAGWLFAIFTIPTEAKVSKFDSQQE